MRVALISVGLIGVLIGYLIPSDFSTANENTETQAMDFSREPMNEPLEREGYRPYDYKETLRPSAEQVRENITDPWMMVMETYIHGAYTPDRISIFIPKGDDHQPGFKANVPGDGAKWEEEYLVFLLLWNPTRGDDSVAGHEIRLDFLKEDGEWEVVWAGHRFRCARGENQGKWTKELCP